MFAPPASGGRSRSTSFRFEGVTVTAEGRGDNPSVATNAAGTNATGYYSVDHLHAGDYSVTISGYGTEYSFDVTSKSVSVGLRETATVSFEGQEP